MKAAMKKQTLTMKKMTRIILYSLPLGSVMDIASVNTNKVIASITKHRLPSQPYWPNASALKGIPTKSGLLPSILVNIFNITKMTEQTMPKIDSTLRFFVRPTILLGHILLVTTPHEIK
jgi:hypothetical protein